ncbi:hypothetical protein N9N67_01465 [Bacteriovoracaceae bacterium]|nr:hypothetical protein [Bacteriovoracaceae bacterium]
MYKIQTMVICLFISGQAFSFFRVFECKEKRNSQKITLDAEVRQNARRGWSSGDLNLIIEKDKKVIVSDRFFINPRRSTGWYDIEYWGRANLKIDTFPDRPSQLRYGRYYDAQIRMNDFNKGRWFDDMECQYIGF